MNPQRPDGGLDAIPRTAGSSATVPSFMSVAFTRTTRRTDEDLDGLFSFLNLDFFVFFLTKSEEDDEADDVEEEGSP